jgi:tRNA(Ile)-lysidine synthase
VRPDLVHRILSAIRKYRMFSGGETILIGLSGGPDSVCLVHILNRLKDSLKLDLHAIYIDHGLRAGETGQEISFCKDFCKSLPVPFITKSIEVKAYAAEQKLNKQEAARLLRYRVFEETAHEVNAHKIALGHTSDDQAETLLMRLFRGAGSAGLAGIPPVRKNIIRPLIDVRRSEIEQYLEDEKVRFITDSSNLKTDYLRNRIRLSLMPVLREINPDITDTLAKTAAIFRDEERYFEIIVTKTLMKLISRKTDSRIELFLSPFGSMDKVVIRRVLRRAIDETKGLRGISFIHIEDMIELIQSGNPGDRLFLPKGIRAIKDYSTFILTSEIPATLEPCTLTVPGETILKEAGIVLKATVDDTNEGEAKYEDSGLWISHGIFDADKLRFPLTARPRSDGDVFYPFGFGKRKKLQDFYVDMKVPRDERNRVPLIVSGEDIIWVVGYRGDERFKITAETKSMLRFEVKKTRD